MPAVLAVTVTIFSTGGQVSTVSWDHFFVSLNHYYMSLRQEVPPAGDMTHLYCHYTKGITPQEVDGLTAVLKLICRIAEQVRQVSYVSHAPFRDPAFSHTSQPFAIPFKRLLKTHLFPAVYEV